MDITIVKGGPVIDATAEQALRAITKNAADAIGLLDSVGTLEAGKRADGISVRGNPLRNIEALREVGLVMKDGRRFDQLSEE